MDAMATMSEAQRDAEAREVLNHQFGSRDAMLRNCTGAFSVGTVEAIIRLGGKYQAGWGITQLPTRW